MNPFSKKQKEIAERKRNIIKLRNDGLTNHEIANSLKVNYSTLIGIVSELIKEGCISPNYHRNTVRRDLNSKLAQTIIGLKKQGATLKEIGNAIGGVTRERARQIIKRIAKEHGGDVFIPDEPFWTISEITSKIGLSQYCIRLLCRRNKIPCKRRIGIRHEYLLTQESIDALARYVKEKKEKRICKICGCLLNSRLYDVLVCSPECYKKYCQRYREKLFVQKITSNNLRSWRLKLWQMLQFHKLPKNEQWVTISEFAKKTGLSQTQVCWLAKRKIIVTHNHPTKKWLIDGKTPILMYSASQAQIVRQVYEEYVRNNAD